METRQEKLLTLVIENHIATAEPVGSKFLVAEGNLDWSEATVRNELRALEEEGYLTHPHTSAGRVPTSKGYRYYVDHFNFDSIEVSQTEKRLLERETELELGVEIRKQFAKNLAAISRETVVVVFPDQIVYYTGLAHLFQKPELSELGVAVEVSSVFDHFEETLQDFFDEVEETPRYFIGEEHDLGNILSVLAVRFGKRGESLLALLGPQRMDYGKNYALLKKILEII